MPVYTQKHQILDRLKKEPLADISDMLDDYVLGQLAMEEQDKTEQEIRDEFWQMWRHQTDCTRRQAKIALHRSGLLDTVETHMNSPDVDMEARLTWTESYRFSRRSSMFDILGPELGLTPEQIDDLFRAAQSIEV